MNGPRKSEGAPRHRGPSHNTNDVAKHNSRSDRSRAPMAWFREYAPAGRRTRYVQLVPACPNCRGAHLHRSPEPVTGGMRTGSCGRRYRLVPARSARIPRPRPAALELAVTA